MSNKKGFTLIELMIVALILGTSLLTVYGVYSKLYSASGRIELKATATALAQEKMEDIINRPFMEIMLWDDGNSVLDSPYTGINKDGSTFSETIVKTASGSESDYIPYQETKSKLGEIFTITTIISWHDDPKDGLASDTNPDPDPNDYKRAHVTVTWERASSSVVLDRFVSLYYRPYANSTAGADAGEFSLDVGTSYARLGSTSLGIYTGGNRTSNATAKAFHTDIINCGEDVDCTDIAWVREYSDDDANTSYPSDINDEELKTSIVNPNSDPITNGRKAGGANSAYVSSGAISNVIGSEPWHSEDDTDYWSDFNEGPDSSSKWPTPPGWSTTEWSQPSAITKTKLDGMTWSYEENIPPDKAFKLFRIGEASAESKSVITSDSAIDKAVSRSWTKIKGVKIVEKIGYANGLIQIGSVEARVQDQTNGASSDTDIYWKLTNVTIDGQSIGDVDKQADIPAITSLTPEAQSIIESIEVGVNTTDSSSSSKAEAKVTALVIKLKPVEISFNDNGTDYTITIPDSTITLGTVESNVSYTTM